MKINPWDKNQDVGPLAPGLTVYTLRLFEEAFPEGLLCDLAWSGRREVIEHFWLKHPHFIDDDARVEIIEMPLREYLDRHFRECSPMNPFWAINRMEFMAKWQAAHAPTPATIGG